MAGSIQAWTEWGTQIYCFIFQIGHPLAENGPTMSPSINYTGAVSQARHLCFMSYVLVLTFDDFHCVKSSFSDRREDSTYLCVFAAWDSMKEERNHLTNYLPGDTFSWAFPGAVGDQQSAPGGLVSSCAKIHCSSSFSEAYAFIFKCLIYFPPTSCAFIYHLICRPLHCSLCRHLDAGLLTCAISKLRAGSCGVLAQKRLFHYQNASHLTPPHLSTSWLAHAWHSWCPAIPPSPSSSLGGVFFPSVHLSPKQLTTFPGSEAAARCRLHAIPPITAVLHHHRNCSPSAVPSRLTCYLLYQSARFIPSANTSF